MRWSLPWQKRSKSHGKDSRNRARELRIETLEDKVLLAVDTWVGGGGNNHWSNAANWLSGVAPSGGDQLIFQGTSLTSTQNDLTAGTSFQSLEFQSASFSIAGNSFTVTGGITTDSGVSGTAISCARRPGRVRLRQRRHRRVALAIGRRLRHRQPDHHRQRDLEPCRK